MTTSIFYSRPNYKWMIFHLFLGIVSIISKWFFIIWFYFFIILSLNKIISDIIIRRTIATYIPFIIYLCSSEVFGRMLGASPFIPWELSKYLIIITSIILLISKSVPQPFKLGFVFILLLVPGLFIDSSMYVTHQTGVIIDAYIDTYRMNNFLGPLSMFLLIIVIGGYKINNENFDIIIKLIWYMAIVVLIYTVIKTPEYSKISFSLGGNDQTSGGFGANQVSTILGLGMFLSFYAWMNKLLFSGSHSLDGLFIGLFAYQGFLTFSRGGMFVGIIAIIFYYVLFRSSSSFKQIKELRSLRPFLFFGLAIVILISTWVLIQDLSSGTIALRYLGETPTTISGDKIRSLNTITTGRYAVFLADLNLWYDNIIFGTGTGYSQFLRGNGLDGIAAHTELSRLLAEHGIFGFLIVVLMFYLFLKIFTINKKNINRPVLICLFIIGIGTSTHSAMRTFVTPILIGLSLMRVNTRELDHHNYENTLYRK